MPKPPVSRWASSWQACSPQRRTRCCVAKRVEWDAGLAALILCTRARGCGAHLTPRYRTPTGPMASPVEVSAWQFKGTAIGTAPTAPAGRDTSASHAPPRALFVPMRPRSATAPTAAPNCAPPPTRRMLRVAVCASPPPRVSPRNFTRARGREGPPSMRLHPRYPLSPPVGALSLAGTGHRERRQGRGQLA